MQARYLLVVVLLLLIAPQSAPAKNIIWISEGRSPALAHAYSTATATGWSLENPSNTVPYDQGFVDLLTAAGHTVDYRTNPTTGSGVTDWESNGYWQGTLTAQQKTDLEAADLVIVSPDFNGTNYGDRNDVSRRDDWNTLNVPLLSLTPQTMTIDAWGWGGTSHVGHLRDIPIGGEQIPFKRAILAGDPTTGYGLRGPKDSVQFYFLDPTAGSRNLTIIRQNWGELINATAPDPEDRNTLVGVTGDLNAIDNNPWIEPEGKSYLQYHTRWQAGQAWYCSPPGETVCTEPTQALPAARRDMFMAAGAANEDLGGFYVGAGVENFTDVGEQRFIDLVEQMAAASPEELRKNRQVPKFTPTIDGTVTAAEIAEQTNVSMVFPMSGGSVIASTIPQNTTAGYPEDEFSAQWYLAWDADNLYVSAVVKDNTPVFNQIGGGTFINQDSIQVNVNPHDNMNPDSKRIYDAVVETGDSAGPSVERSGGVPIPAIDIAGQHDGSGYTLELAIPWSEVVVGAGTPGYVPSHGDEHGLSFQLRGKTSGSLIPALQGAITSHFIDYGFWEGFQHEDLDLVDPLAWNKITLIDDSGFTADLDLDGDVDGLDFLIGQQQGFPGNFLTDFHAQYGEPGPPLSSLGAVPEPQTISILLLACLALVFVDFRRPRWERVFAVQKV